MITTIEVTVPRSPAHILHDLAGHPEQKGCAVHPATCVVCGRPHVRTMPYDSWQGANFTDQNKLRGHGLSDRVCEPCVWAHAWVPPPGWTPDPAQIERKREAKRALGKTVDESKERPPNLRLFWHAWDARGYVFGTKGDKPTLRAWLLAPKEGAWFCAIPDSGQKHVLPWTRLNLSPRGRLVRLEEQDLAIGGCTSDLSLVDVMTESLTAGITKDEIDRGAYTSRSWSIAEEHVRELLRRGECEHGSAWWSLAVWLAQRDEERAAERMADEKMANTAKKEARKSAAKTQDEACAESAKGAKRGSRAASGGSARRDGGADQGDARGVPGKRRRRADALGPAPVAHDESVPADGDGGSVRDDAAEGATPDGGQLTLF
ncbi:MAG: hypothetical protein MUE69_34200 [Myxococcota bacterium]|jgi:hypothetical protein|nr:hypothetical protein [Myxococcota bacterium]